MSQRLFDLPSAAAISWVRYFFVETWSLSEVESFVAFCRQERRDATDRLVAQGVPYGSLEFIKVNQIWNHVRDQAWLRNRQLSRIDSVNSKIRERVAL